MKQSKQLSSFSTKLLLLILLACTFVGFNIATAFAATDAVMLGDVNCDNSADTLDALVILRWDAGMGISTVTSCAAPSNTTLNSANCDVSGDARCDTLDALYILQCDAGIKNIFCNGSVTKPTLSITNITEGELVNGSKTVTACAEHASGIQSIAFSLDGVLLPNNPVASTARSVEEVSASAGTITIDGLATDWTSAELVGTDPAYDGAQAVNRIHHERQVDFTGLYATWDATNLYLALQGVDVIDVVDPANANSGDKITSWPVPIGFFFDTRTGGYSVGGDMWAKPLTFGGTNLPDYELYIKMNNENGPYLLEHDGTAWLPYAANVKGIAQGLLSKQGNSYAGGAVTGADGKNYLTSGYDTKRSSFWEVKVPLNLIGSPNLETGCVQLFVANAESSLDSIPNDPASTDLVGVSSSNSPLEWADTDKFTSTFVKIGRGTNCSSAPVATVTPTATQPAIATPTATPSATTSPANRLCVSTTINSANYTAGKHSFSVVATSKQNSSATDMLNICTTNCGGTTPVPTTAPTTVPTAAPTTAPTVIPPTIAPTVPPTPVTPVAGIKVHYKGWATPKIYAWKGSGTTVTKLRGDWPGTAMTAEANGWFGDSFPTESSINLIFNSGSNQTADLSRTSGEWWYFNGQWYASDPEDAVAPAVSITSPTGGNVSGVVPITVNATDNKGVVKVEFLVNGAKVGESTTAPFTYNWTTTSSCGGAAALTATAYDGAGNKTTSAVVNVAINNPNQAPVANAGTDFSVPANVSAQFNGAASKDDCGIVSYSWNNGLTGVSPLKMYSTPGTYKVILTVTDAAGLTSSDEVVLTVVSPTTRGDFREETIYFLITTRFFDGDSSNNLYSWDSRFGPPNNDPEWRGDFKGLGAKLDYIKALGFSAIWITPVVKNMSGYDYHGYHAVNFKQVDSRYESADYNYQRLINEAHARGIKVIQDVVFNHTGNFGEENLYPMFTKNPALPDTAANMVKIAPAGLLPDNYDTILPGLQYAARINAMKEDTKDTGNIYHHEKSLSWESYTVQTGQIAGDAVDLNTENPVVYKYLIDAYNQYIDMGVDAFRVDTVKHISRLTFNKTFNPAFKARGGQNFFMFGEIAARYRNVWNSGIPAISVPFYTWAESKSYGWSDTDWKVNKGLVEQHWADNLNTGTQPTSNNHLLNGNIYHAPDRSKSSGLDVIDFPMHWSFVSAGEAFGIAVGGDQYYNDATWNVTYVDSHDYAPDTAPEGQRFAQPQDTWAENLSLMFTFRGIPTIYYGSEIEFKKGKEIDKGPTIALEDSGRAYFGANLEGSVTTTGYGVYSNATGQMATTLSHPLAQHIRRLNLIRRAVPALQKGQYSREGVSGSLAFKRRYTANGVDSFALVTISGNSTFSGIPGGTYVDAITGNSITVAEGGTLTASVSGKGNMRVYVLNGPGKIGVDGTYLK